MAGPEKEKEASSSCGFKSVCIFGSSTLGKDYKFLGTATELGKALATRGINVVYGGGIHGLRGGAAASAIMGGSHVIGILARQVADKTYFTFGNELKVLSMHERFEHMICTAKAFIALPGGLETLEGISSVTFWAKSSDHRKPLGLININGFYDGLLAFLDHAVEQGFIPLEVHRNIITCSNVDQLIDQLQVRAFQSGLLVKQVDEKPPDDSRKRKVDTILQL